MQHKLNDTALNSCTFLKVKREQKEEEGGREDALKTGLLGCRGFLDMEF